MLYGDNILPTAAAAWTVVNGTVTSEAIALGNGGSASCTIDITTLSSIPSAMLLSVIASRYTDFYTPDFMAKLTIVDTDGNQYNHYYFLDNTGANTCNIELPLTEVEPASITFTFITVSAVTITSFGLFPPKSSEVDLTEVLDKIPRLLSDYNYATMTIGQAEDIVGLISAYITETTEMTGRITLSYVATANCILTIRIKDNNTSELYTPMLFYVNAGSGTIGIPHAYLVKLKGYHTFTVTAQVSTGTMTLRTRQIFYVIDGGRLAYNVLDVGSVVYDLSVRQLESETAISYIYAICIDNGVCLVKKCEYSDTPGAAWVSEASLGNAIDAAIEFDGTWALSDTPYIFSTEENPYVAWVTEDNILYIKKLNDDASTFIASTGVTAVCSIKGWDNGYTAGYDQGLLFFYIKSDGLVYYRGYCRQANETYIWEVERNITDFTGAAVDVTAFKTNDFRVGINILDDAGTTHTYITYRNWAGMSFRPENLTGTLLDPVVTVTPIMYWSTYMQEEIAGLLSEPSIDVCPYDYTSSNVLITLAKRIDDYHIKLTFNYPLLNVANQEALFTVTNKTVTATAVGDTAYEVVITTAEALQSVGVFDTIYTKAYTGIKVVITNYCHPRLEDQAVDASGDPPNSIAQVTVELTNATVVVTHVDYLYGYVNKVTDTYLEGSLTNATVVITHVGSSPL
jgi:hypothetical protein